MFDEIRQKIDKIDAEILALLKGRFELAKQLGDIKKGDGMPIFDQVREDLLRERLAKLAEKDGLSSEFVADLYDIILEESRRLQG